MKVSLANRLSRLFQDVFFKAVWLAVCGAWLGAAPSIRAQTRDYGVDVSHYQGSTGVSQSGWNQVEANGRTFAYIKATEGLTGPHDAAMTNNVTRALAAGLLVGVYHYPHPENRPTTNGAVQEADIFLSYAGDAVGPGRLRPVLDLEGSASTLSTAALTDWVIAFSDRIIAQRGVAAAPIIYVNRSYANSELDARMAGYDLWLAYYTNVDWNVATFPPTTSYPKPMGVFTNWVFWQYSSSGNAGGINPVDVDVCHSEYKSLASLLIPYPPVRLTAARSGGGFQLGFTNVPGRAFTIRATTNLALPATNWTVLGTATETSAGNYSFSDASGGSAQKFYRVQVP